MIGEGLFGANRGQAPEARIRGALFQRRASLLLSGVAVPATIAAKAAPTQKCRSTLSAPSC